jgi:hypothetical protein
VSTKKLHLGQLSFKIYGEIKTFQGKHKLKQFMTTKPRYIRYKRESYTENRKKFILMRTWERIKIMTKNKQMRIKETSLTQ